MLCGVISVGDGPATWDRRTDVMTCRRPPWAHSSLQEPKRVKMEPDAEAALSSKPQSGADAARLGSASTEELRVRKIGEHGLAASSVARTPSQSTAEAEVEVEHALLPGHASIVEDFDMGMEVSGQGAPDHALSATPTRTRTASPDVASSSVDPNDIISPLATPSARRPAAGGASLMNVEGGSIQDIYPNSGVLREGIAPASLSTRAPSGSLSGGGVVPQPLSRSDTASTQSTLVEGIAASDPGPAKRSVSASVTPRHSAAPESAPTDADENNTKKDEDEPELDPDVVQYITRLGLAPHIYASRLALIGLTSGAIIAATRNYVSEARKDKLEEDLQRLSGLSVLECAVLISGLRRSS